MIPSDPFDDLLDSLGGFYRSWLVYLGLELGLFEVLRQAGEDGMTPGELSHAVGGHPEAIDLWAWAADAHDLAELKAAGSASTPSSPRRCSTGTGSGTSAVSSSTASLRRSTGAAWWILPDRDADPRTTRPLPCGIERLTAQDVAVFFQEALAALPRPWRTCRGVAASSTSTAAAAAG